MLTSREEREKHDTIGEGSGAMAKKEGKLWTQWGWERTSSQGSIASDSNRSGSSRETERDRERDRDRRQTHTSTRQGNGPIEDRDRGDRDRGDGPSKESKIDKEKRRRAQERFEETERRNFFRRTTAERGVERTPYVAPGGQEPAPWTYGFKGQGNERQGEAWRGQARQGTQWSGTDYQGFEGYDYQGFQRQGNWGQHSNTGQESTYYSK
eukprot:Platyproteum_vivax@DN2235_c0_g1_i1.p1